VPLALGTDTAGSGRVPAGLNNIVGLKPSLGTVPTTGVVPACRTLDCVSVFALTTDDAWLALSVMAGQDKEDAYARARPVGALDQLPTGIKLGVPMPKQRLFFDREFESAYAQSLEKFEELGCMLIETDMQPFYETARLLYEGPWVAERAVVVRELLASIPDAIHPVTRAIIEPGLRISAANAFATFYRLEELRRTAEGVFNTIDMLAVPTAPAAYTVEQVLADPIKLNSNLGAYTNFVNLLDLCGIAVPASVTANGVPFGITLLGPGGQDAKTASLGRAFHAEARLPYGALAMPSHQLTDD
jgi:allophanate hydrolase